MFKTVELPASVTNLATSLANVYGDTFSLNNVNITKVSYQFVSFCSVYIAILPSVIVM